MQQYPVSLVSFGARTFGLHVLIDYFLSLVSIVERSILIKSTTLIPLL